MSQDQDTGFRCRLAALVLGTVGALLPGAGGAEPVLAETNVGIGVTALAQPGKQIVIAGGKGPSDPLAPVTGYLGNLAYNTLLYRGYAKNNVRYLNPVTGQDVDGNGAGTNASPAAAAPDQAVVLLGDIAELSALRAGF